MQPVAASNAGRLPSRAAAISGPAWLRLSFGAKFLMRTLRNISLLAYVLMVLSLIALVPQHALFSTNPLVIGSQVLAAAVLLWARFSFGLRSFHVAATPTKGGLVMTGPYRYIRHPIYTSMCVLGWAGILSHWSLWPAACGAVLVGAGLVRMLCEERLLAEQYPEYTEYAKRTWRMVPYVF
jgi:protein-S-isoprenylcysteine O-methyltransferase Ste14